MLGSRIGKVLEKFPSVYQNYLGLFEYDSLPSHEQFPRYHFLVTLVNNIHWVSVYNAGPEHVDNEHDIFEVFDSLAAPLYEDIVRKHFPRYMTENLIISKTAVQPESSSNCGAYVLYQIIERSYNADLSFNDLNSEIFSAHVMKNERLIRDFFEEYGFVNQNSINSQD